MTGLRRSKTRLLEATSLVQHKVVIRAGNPSLKELDWAIEVIYPEMRALTFISSSVTKPKHINPNPYNPLNLPFNPNPNPKS